MNYAPLRQTILFVADLFLYYLSIVSLWAIDLYLRRMDSVFWHDYIWGFTTFLPLFFIVHYIFDLYSDDITMNGISLLKGSINASATTALFAFLWLHKFRFFFYVRSILSFIIFAIITFALFSLWRRIYFALFAKQRNQVPALYLELDNSQKELEKVIQERPFCGLEIVRKFNLKEESLNNLNDVLEEKKIQYLIVDDHCFKDSKVVHQIFQALPLQIEVIRLSSFLENLCHCVYINHIEEHWFLDNLVDSSKKIHDRLKTFTDKFLSLALLIALLPLMVFIGFLVGLSSGFPIIYSQKRVGHLGKEFTLYKFRSMRNDAEKDGAKWASPGDTRVTKFGSFLRKTRLDELPQLINVLKGEMSFIGPRPERPEFVQKLNEAIPFYNERHLVKPGLTGWAQVSYRYGMNENDALKKLQFDLYYIKNRSFVLELAIILKTIRVVVYQSGT